MPLHEAIWPFLEMLSYEILLLLRVIYARLALEGQR